MDEISASHGVRTIDNLRHWCGLTDQAALEVWIILLLLGRGF